MSCNSYQFCDTLSCTPYSYDCCGGTPSYSVCCSQPLPNYSDCIPTQQISKLASFALGNSESCGRNEKYTCCEPQPPPPRPIRPKVCCKPIPPCCIDNAPNNCKGMRSSPAERLKNVDVLEELCYFVPGDPAGDQETCCYRVCDCCGASELVGCSCPCKEKPPPNPVKYSRKQRFSFQDEQVKMNCFDQGPTWPFENNKKQQQPQRQQYCQDDFSNNLRRTPTRKDTSCKVLPPTTGVYYFDSTRKVFIPQCDLPKPPQVLYQQATSMPKDRRRSPNIQEFEVFEEETEVEDRRREPQIQRVIQPIIINNPPNNSNNNNNNNSSKNNSSKSKNNSCNSNASNYNPSNNNQQSCYNPSNQCYPCNPCNPCTPFNCGPCYPYNPCNPFNPCMQMPFGNMCNPFPNMCNPPNMSSIIPMCIPMCQPSPPPLPPMQQPYPQMPPNFASFEKPKKSKKKKKSEDKKKKSSREQEITLDFMDQQMYNPAPPQAQFNNQGESPIFFSNMDQANSTTANPTQSAAASPIGSESSSESPMSSPTPESASPNQSVALSPIGSQSKKKSSSPMLSPNKTSPTVIQSPDGSKMMTTNNNDIQNRPDEGYSTNVLVFGGPEKLANNMGPLPPGTFTQGSMDSEMKIMPQPLRNSNEVKKDSGASAQLQPAAMATESIVVTKGP